MHIGACVSDLAAPGEALASRVVRDLVTGSGIQFESPFRGVTRSVAGDIVISALDERTVRLEGAATFDVRDFGMEPPRILMLRVEPEVNVRVELIAEREG
jgi:hypothetical protein